MKKRRLLFGIDCEKDEAWLNEMSAKGLACTGISALGRFTFVECKPGEYIYRAEILKNFVWNREGRRYLEFLNDKSGFALR